MLEPVRPIELGDIEEARARIAGTVLRTPLVKLDAGSEAPDIEQNRTGPEGMELLGRVGDGSGCPAGRPAARMLD